MGAFQARPAALEVGAARLMSGGIDLAQVAGRLDAILAGAAGALAGTASGAAVGDCRLAWPGATTTLAGALAELAGKVGGAGAAYTAQDAAVAGAAVAMAAPAGRAR